MNFYYNHLFVCLLILLDQWKVKDADKLSAIVKKIDLDFSKSGYKTLGVVVKINDNPWEYCGILPMLDPPRHDTAETIRNLVNAGNKLIITIHHFITIYINILL